MVHGTRLPNNRGWLRILGKKVVTTTGTHSVVSLFVRTNTDVVLSVNIPYGFADILEHNGVFSNQKRITFSVWLLEGVKKRIIRVMSIIVNEQRIISEKTCLVLEQKSIRPKQPGGRFRNRPSSDLVGKSHTNTVVTKCLRATKSSGLQAFNLMPKRPSTLLAATTEPDYRTFVQRSPARGLPTGNV